MNNTPDSAHEMSSATLSVGSWLLSIISFVVDHFTKSNVAFGLGLVSGSVAAISGIMAIRYYYYATKNLKKNK